MNKAEQFELININRELIDLMERLQPLQSQEAKTAYELVSLAVDYINGDVEV
jgi:hypothetical protein